MGAEAPVYAKRKVMSAVSISKAAAFGAACALLLAASTARAGGIPQPGSPAPDFAMTLIANGKGSVSLATFKGHPLYLNFFASWCQPCKAELPSIVSLSKTYSKKGVIVLGVDELESTSAALGFVKTFDVPYPVGIDDSGSIGAAYGLIGMPMHVFVGADGKVVLRRDGEMSADQIKAALDTIATR
jgi:cytochrome c biogenesis protein CcmG/thiol:disulfide interchange protein DsbE